MRQSLLSREGRSFSSLVLFSILAVVSLGMASRAVARTWRSSDGAYSVDAEFVECKDDDVSLRTADGKMIQVSLSRLCKEDQAYVCDQRDADDATSSETTDTSPSSAKRWTFTQLIQSANHLTTAADVVQMFRLFLQDKNAAEADRKAAETQLPVWEDRAKKRMVRVGLGWYAPLEAYDLKRQARQLTDEAVRLIEVSQNEAAIEKCLKASKVDPDDIRADFLLGLGYALFQRDAKEANQHFAECVRRDPQHISALNNLALSEVRLRKYTQALAHWQTALELAPAAPEVIQNLGRLVALAQQRRANVSPSLQRRTGDLYAATAISASAARFNDHTGWLYMGYYERRSGRIAAKTKADQSSPQTTVSCSGSGFVVYPEYILTNRHVVDGSVRLFVTTPGEMDHTLPADVVAMADGQSLGYDFAVIHCKGMTAQPLTFVKGDLAPCGTEIVIIGFPVMPRGDTPSLKSSRGIIAGLPDESCNTYFFDAMINPGNSGGPVCDATGSVLGIAVAHTVGLPMNYSLGIPHSRTLSLLDKCIPGYRPLPSQYEVKPWVDVVDIVGHSTVRIRVEIPESSCGISPDTRPKDHKKAGALEDRWCITCYGLGTVECPNRNCRKGTVGDVRQKVVAVAPGSGQPLIESMPIRVPCETCKGKGVVRCRDCIGGIDKSVCMPHFESSPSILSQEHLPGR